MLAGLGLDPASVERLPGGETNHTVLVRRGTGDVVVRVPLDPLAADVFPVEAWASAAAARSGVTVAPVLRTGHVDGVPFLVAEYVRPDPRPVDDPWRWLGRTARLLATIPLVDAPPSLYTRFGADLASAWDEHVRYGLRSLDGDDPVRAAGAYTDASRLRAVFDGLLDRGFRHGLAHGDLAPRNLLSRGPDADPVLIDWGSTETGPTPWTDARRVTAWARVDGTVSPQHHDTFMAAAGLAGSDDQRTLTAMTALHLVDVTRWARERRPDRFRQDVDRCRRGLVRLGLSD